MRLLTQCRGIVINLLIDVQEEEVKFTEGLKN